MEKIEHLVIFRTGGNVLNIQSYNCQEIGLAKALTRRGVKVSVVMAGNEERVETIDVDGKSINVYYLTFISLTLALSRFKNWEKTLEKIRPSHIQIHEFGVWMSYQVTKWAKKNNVPVFLVQGVYQTTPKPGFRLLEKIYNKTFGKNVIKNARAVGCKSHKASEYVKKYYERDTSIVYIGLDASKIQKTIDKNWRQELGIIDKKVLLYVGIMENRRNPLLLIDIVRHLSEEYVLLMVGGGPLADQVRDSVEAFGLKKRVFMLGKIPQNELSAIYNSSDLFLLASSYEIYGMVIMESMYFGVPVLSSKSGGADVIIDHQKDGLIVDTFDRDKWVSEIEKVFANEKLLDEMGLLAKHKIVERFVWDKSVESFIELYGK